MARMPRTLPDRMRLVLRRQFALPRLHFLRRHGVERRQLLLQRGDFSLHRRPFPGLLRRRQFQRRLIDAVEEGEELVILALRNRIELVVVTLAAADRQAEENAAGRVDAIDDRLDAELFHVDAAFLVDLRIAVEAGGDQSLVGEPVA